MCWIYTNGKMPAIPNWQLQALHLGGGGWAGVWEGGVIITAASRISFDLSLSRYLD